MASIWILGSDEKPGYDIYYSILDGKIHSITKFSIDKEENVPLSEAPYLLQRLVTERYKRGGKRVCACEKRYADNGYINLMGLDR